jgi:hypothetical protein
MTSRSLLVLAMVVIAVIWQLPYGQQALYPFTLLATYAHEMGHGLAALMVGGQFDRLILNADGSGLAHWRGNPGRLAVAWVAASGLLGPSVAGVALLLMSRSPRHARLLLGACAVLIFLTVVLWASNPFGIVFLLGAAACLALSARWLPDLAAAFLLNFIAALLCLSWLRDLDYMFSSSVVLADGVHRSDTGLIANALFLPYWFWGAVVALISLALLIAGFRLTTWPPSGERV